MPTFKKERSSKYSHQLILSRIALNWALNYNFFEEKSIELTCVDFTKKNSEQNVSLTIKI